MSRFFILALYLAVTGAHAEPSTKAMGAIVVPTVGYLEAISGLLLVLLLIMGLGWAVKRLGITPANKGVVRIIGGVSLGARERALVLEADGKRILVGVAPGQVRPLMRLDDAAPGRPEAEIRVAPAEGFSQQLQKEQAKVEDKVIKEESAG